MFVGTVDEKAYLDEMYGLVRMCRELHKAYNSYEYNKGITVRKCRDYVKSGCSGIIEGIITKCRSFYGWKQIRKHATPIVRPENNFSAPAYFSQERIAVYTCIFGRYDELNEPICHPNNIDYYVVTDLEVSEDSTWKKIDISRFSNFTTTLSDVEKNRWYKMHSDIVFEEYRYSVYIDGNVIPVTDFTELVNRIGLHGIAMYWHSPNNCVYQESMYNKYIVRKVDIGGLQKHVDYIRAQGMPEDYGMTTCNVIARDHKNATCIKIMRDWWIEFINHCRRDQISFPYVVWKNGVLMSEIATLGNDVWTADSLYIVRHNS